MRLALITMSAPSDANPYSGQYNLHQARAMKALGHEVEIFVPAMWLPSVLGAVHAGVRRLVSVPSEWERTGVRLHSARGLMLHPNVLRYKLWPIAPAIVAKSVTMAHRRRLERNVAVFRPDAILAHEGALLGDLAHCIAERLAVPWGVIEHDSFDITPGTAPAKWYLKTMSSAKAVLGVGDASLRRMREIGLSNASLALDGIDAATDEQLRTPRPKELDGKLVVLSSGSPVVEKGHAELVRAFTEVCSEVASALLVLVGPLTPAVEKMIEDSKLAGRVRRLDRMPGREFQQWLVWADVFCLPSYRESFGMVFAEALAAGTPVILTDACGIAPMLTPGRHGWVVPVRDHEALTRALREALTTADLKLMGSAGRELMAGKLSWENSARAVLKAMGAGREKA